MANILFTPPSDQKILAGTKTMTARCWKKKPPRIGQVIHAQTGYANSTRFAKLKVLGVWEWDGKMDGKNAEYVTGLTRNGIAQREGFGNTLRPAGSWLTDWDAFIEAYYGLNAQKFLDDGRKHWFVEFELIRKD